VIVVWKAVAGAALGYVSWTQQGCVGNTRVHACIVCLAAEVWSEVSACTHTLYVHSMGLRLLDLILQVAASPCRPLARFKLHLQQQHREVTSNLSCVYNCVPA
jgi:hypothetical protein